MKSFSKSMLGFMILALLPLVGFSQVIEDDAVIIYTPGGFLGDYQLGLSQTTSFGGGSGIGLFGVGISGSNDQFLFTSFGIAEPFSLFPVELGDVVTPNFVNSVNTSTPFTANFDFNDPLGGVPPVGAATLEDGDSIFLGYWDDRGGPRTNVADEIDNYGWLELRRNDSLDPSLGNLEILGGATAIGNGIIVGTTTVAVPEPSTTMLLGLLGVAGLIRRRR